MWVDEIDPKYATAEQVAWLKRRYLAEREEHHDDLKKLAKALEQCIQLHDGLANHKTATTIKWLVIAMIGTQVFGLCTTYLMR